MYALKISNQNARYYSRCSSGWDGSAKKGSVFTTGSRSTLRMILSWQVMNHEIGKLLFARVHPGRLTCNIIIEVWKIIFLSKWVICRFYVNLPGCSHLSVLFSSNSVTLVLDMFRFTKKTNQKSIGL